MSQNLLSLRRLSPRRAHATGTAILATAEEKDIAKAIKESPIAEAFSQLQEATDALGQAFMAQPQEDSNPSYKAQRQADRELDRAVGAFYRLLHAYHRMPVGDPLQQSAEHMLARLFPERLSITQLPWNLQWSAVEVLLSECELTENAKELKKFHATPFLRQIRKSHEAFGDLIHTTKAAKEEEEAKSASPQQLMPAWEDALQQIAILAMALPFQHEDGEAISKRIMRPYHKAAEEERLAFLRRRSRKNQEVEGEDPAPQAPAPDAES